MQQFMSGFSTYKILLVFWQRNEAGNIRDKRWKMAAMSAAMAALFITIVRIRPAHHQGRFLLAFI